MTLHETLTKLPYDYEIELKHRLGDITFTDRAGSLLEDSDANRVRLEDYELVSKIILPDSQGPPDLPPHLRPYQLGDIGGAIPPPDPAIILGPIGEWLTLVEPETEASLASLGGGLLAALGSWLGNQVRLGVGRISHPPNLLVVQAGYTGIARKGTADNEIIGFLRHVDQTYATLNIGSGFGSGEALIQRVSDPVYDKENQIISGTKDQRLYVMEGEFSKVLRTADRKGSILGDVIRLVYDGRPIANLTKNQKLISSHHCVSLFGGITPDELVAIFPVLAATSGTGNRYIWVWSNPTKFLPDGGNPIEATAIANKIRQAPMRGQTLTRTPNAVEWWNAHYETLRASLDVPAAARTLTTRTTDHIQRIALIYAATEGATQVDVPHFEAAHAWTRHSTTTVTAILGGLVRNPDATRILVALRSHPGVGATLSEIHDVFARNTTGTAIDAAISDLEGAGLAYAYDGPQTGGRPPRMVIATTPVKDFLRSYREKETKNDPKSFFVKGAEKTPETQVDTVSNTLRKKGLREITPKKSEHVTNEVSPPDNMWTPQNQDPTTHSEQPKEDW